MPLQRTHCYQALSARDPRFDGVFFVGVTTTGIYCRPICPARTPREAHCLFFVSAAAAERREFRPCLRCRPELAPHVATHPTSLDPWSPESGERHASSGAATPLAPVDVVRARAAGTRIASGALDAGSLDTLATQLGTSTRHLRRIVEQEFGASPVALAQTRRLLTAKQLLTDSTLSMTQVAMASGFGSVRRFNALFQGRYRLAPSALRESARRSAPAPADDATMLPLSLGVRPPYDWSALSTFLAGRAIPGVETVSRGPDGRSVYARVVRLHGHVGLIRVTGPDPRNARRVTVHVAATLLPVLVPLLARLRHLLDLDATPSVIAAHLQHDPLLAHAVAASPGRRVPGCLDGFELAVRAVLGQQVSVRGASTLAGRLVLAVAQPLASLPLVHTADVPPSSAPQRTSVSSPVSLTHEPLCAERLADASIELVSGIGLPRTRAQYLITLARTVAEGGLPALSDAELVDTNSETATRDFMDAFTAIPGIGPWTAHYVAMRALHHPDAFPDGDLALQKAAGGLTAGALARRADGWRPWRAYAAMHLWASLS